MSALLGDIMQIASRGTCTRAKENAVMLARNSEFIEDKETNWTAHDRNACTHVPLGVSYGNDPTNVRSVLMRVARYHPEVLDMPLPDGVFPGFGDRSRGFEPRVSISEQVTSPQVVASDLYSELFPVFQDEGIEIPFPQRDLHLRSVSQTVSAFSVSSGGRPKPRQDPENLRWTDRMRASFFPPRKERR